METWKAVRIYENRSDFLRDLLKIGIALIRGGEIHLSHGSTIVVNNPQVTIKVPRKHLRGAVPFKRGAVKTAAKKLEKAMATLHKLRLIDRVEKGYAILNMGGMEYRLREDNLRKMIIDAYREIVEARKLLDEALLDVGEEEEEKHSEGVGDGEA